MAKKHHKDDKLIMAYYNAVDFFDKNKKHVYIAIGILVLAIAGIVGLVNQRKENNEAAALELSKVKSYYEMNQYQQAIYGDTTGAVNGLLFIAENYGSTDNGEIAKIMLANAFFNLRDFDNAEKWYKDYSGNIDLLDVASIAGVAAVNEARQNYREAGKLFENAYNKDKNNPFRDEFLYYAGRNYFMAEDTENAKRVFEELKEKFPRSKYIAQAERYNAVLVN
jgi:tetratricopeptide (TPR) repeat protein